MMNQVVSSGSQPTQSNSMHVEPKIGHRYLLPSGALVEVERINAERAHCTYLIRTDPDPVSNRYVGGEVTFTCDWLETYGRAVK